MPEQNFMNWTCSTYWICQVAPTHGLCGASVPSGSGEEELFFEAGVMDPPRQNLKQKPDPALGCGLPHFL